MGRGNVCVSGKYEGLYYLDWECFEDNFVDEDDDEFYDDTDGTTRWANYQADRDLIVEYFCDRFKSFTPCDEWIRKGFSSDQLHVIAENRLYYLVEEDNEWSMAIELIQKEDAWGAPLDALQSKHFPNYFQGLKECLFDLFPEIGAYGGAWTHRTLYRNEVARLQALGLAVG